MGSSPEQCPVFRPSKDEFSKPFCTYIRKLLKKHPDVAMFRVIPPNGWSPRTNKPFPKLRSIDIACPIKQLAFGTQGAYRCILIEQKPLTAQDFKELSEQDSHKPPSRERDKEDVLKERSFWSSLTINPPLYGADTPQSFFDEELPYGWNLRDLKGCLLKKYDVPDIAGVTTPMTYFGMWKSFFSWHVEDADLYSINYLHFGAPKVWYCVPPSQKGKFERMCQSVYPELHKACPAFMRHKDIMLSPALLRTYGVEYTQAIQEPNQFIVLNAAAYHAGYNLGFNCAEAVNFATEDWLAMHKSITKSRCKCDAMQDGVRISMRIFGLPDTDTDSESASDEEGSDSEGDSQDSSGSSTESENEGDEVKTPPAKGRKQQQEQHGSSNKRSRGAKGAAAGEEGTSTPVKRGRGRPPKVAVGDKRPAAGAVGDDHLGPETPGPKKGRKGAQEGAGAGKPGSSPRMTQTAKAAAAAAAKQRSGKATAAARAKLSVTAGRVAKQKQQQQRQPRGKKQQQDEGEEGSGQVDGTANEQQQQKVDEPESPRASKALLNTGGNLKGAGDGGLAEWDGKEPPSTEDPQVILGEDKGKKYFYMVQVLKGMKARVKGHLVMRWLKEEKDGLFRPSSSTWEEAKGALVPVRTQWVRGNSRKPGGYRLLTLRSRILDTELVD